MYRRLQDSQAPGPSFISEIVEAPTEVPRKAPKSPTTSALVFWKLAKSTSIIELLPLQGIMCIVNYLVYLLYNLGALAKFM